MTLSPGTRVGPYEILAPIGAGGMGEVYRARDIKLDRYVALKILPPSLAQDPERLARFEREAKVLASLNHPHIAQIYGVEEHALIMELVPGEPLKGPLPLETALSYARQIAEALEAAHEKGIVHRDLKPANVMVTPEGVVKVLDFGIAAVTPQSTSEPNTPLSHTLPMPTRAGVIIGTAAYMSPEQASGKPVDKRADIWSFGVVLWEILSGHPLFEGETFSHTLADVLRGPIDFDKLPRDTPPSIRDLLRRCLDRNVKNRLRDIGEARVIIDQSLTAGPFKAAPERPAWLPWSIAGALAVGLVSVALLHFLEKPTVPPAPLRFQLPLAGATSPWSFLSPDGRKLAFVAGGRLKIHFLDSGETRELTDYRGTPIWSPDSRFLVYPSETKLRKIAVTGGPSETVADFSGDWGAGDWSKDDVILFGAAGGLFRVPASGGVPVKITAFAPQDEAHFRPSFLADGRHFVYIRASNDPDKSAIYLGSVDAKPEQQSLKPLVASKWGPWYAPSPDPNTGFLLFLREGTLMAQHFDNRRLELTGQEMPVAENVEDPGSPGYGSYSASGNDVLVFHQFTASARQLTWYDRDGKTLGTVGEAENYRQMALSPDGKRLAWSKSGGKGANIWLLDLSSGASTRFTFGSTTDTSPVWSPDGSRIVFTSNNDLYQKEASGVKEAELLLKSGDETRATSWSRDGRFLLYTAKYNIWVLPMKNDKNDKGDKKPVLFLPAPVGSAQFSPDGHWVAYASFESGPPEVYVRSFSMNAKGTAVEPGGKWQVSNGLGAEPRWRADGREIYYRNQGVMAAEIATTPVFRPGKPRALGAAQLASYPSAWDSSADGKRFLTMVGESGPKPFTVVLNWQTALKK